MLGFMVAVGIANSLRVTSPSNDAEQVELLQQNETVQMQYYKELENPSNGVFTACSVGGGAADTVLNCFQRVAGSLQMPIRKLDHLTYSTDFDLLSTEPQFVTGEDPRVLNSSHIFDNYLDDMFMIDTRTKQRYPVYHKGSRAKGKNYVWYVHKSQLYAIRWFQPLEIIACTKKDEGLHCDDYYKENSKHSDQSLRGGTVGFSSGDEVNGFGHKTFDTNHHTVIQWKLKDLDSGKPKVQINDVKMPGSLSICDPTSVLVIKGIPYLFTSESTGAWFHQQTYHNKVYKIEGPNSFATNFARSADQATFDLASMNDDYPTNKIQLDITLLKTVSKLANDGA